jgi:hypothetical protein
VPIRRCFGGVSHTLAVRGDGTLVLHRPGFGLFRGLMEFQRTLTGSDCGLGHMMLSAELTLGSGLPWLETEAIAL